MKRVKVFLIVLALIAGMVGCVPVQYSLTISSTEGGEVTTPGVGTSTYEEGMVVDLIATPDSGYRFVNWTGDVDTIADAEDANTTITMNGDCSIVANFALGVLVRDWYDLDAIRDNPGGSYLLMNNLDSTTLGYEELASSIANGGKGWQPIGTFSGTFSGQGYEIRDLSINRPDEDLIGLFGVVDVGGVVKDIGVVNVTVISNSLVGGLVGDNNGTVRNSYATGNVTSSEGYGYVGGLAGWNWGTVSKSYSTCSVRGGYAVGGLVGRNYEGTVSNSYATGSVTGNGDCTGGLVGDIAGGAVSNSYSTGSVTGEGWVGGLVGQNSGNVSNSYSSAEVMGSYRLVGGLVGFNCESGAVTKSYATGSVIGEYDVGGLVGVNAGTVSDSYSTGSVTGEYNVGGLVADGLLATVSNSFWDTQTSGQATSAGGTGKTTADMKNSATFSGAEWDIIAVADEETNPAYTWNIVDGETYPFLSWQSVS